MNKKTHPLRTWRKAHGLEQTELAKLAGISQKYISHIETGIRVPRYNTAKAISEATGGEVSVLEIMEFTP